MKFRIVADKFNGYELQVKRFFKWQQVDKRIPRKSGGFSTNTFTNIDEARIWASKWLIKKQEVKVIEEFEANGS